MNHTAKAYGPSDYDAMTPQPDNAFSRLDRAVDTLMKAESVVRELAEQLIGTVPVPIQGGESKGSIREDGLCMSG
ncbi:hypothetical protein J1C56_01880 [Aminobacter anthyllidis]|uniref:Uncharacterized protein n=1 Tax=Aminobacter anthyllidis TaxID=1035067 RepID=A0A9X1A6Q5_9HYPH|nr:hypothetical protein [Aminobacter anthyllidis]MBT1154334.1 hypothetical protein [Aminobacter anthyllidis]